MKRLGKAIAFKISILFILFLPFVAEATNANLDLDLGSPLINLVEYGTFDEVKNELNRGANANVTGFVGVTALMRASYKGNKEIVQLLLNNNADALVKDEGGASALHYAVRAGNLEIVDILVKHNADVNDLDKTGFSPLDRARSFNMRQIVGNLENAAFILPSHLPISQVVSGQSKEVLYEGLGHHKLEFGAENDSNLNELIVGQAILVRDHENLKLFDDVEMNSEFKNTKNKNHIAMIEGIKDFDELIRIWEEFAKQTNFKTITASIDAYDEHLQLKLGQFSKQVDAEKCCSQALKTYPICTIVTVD